MGPRAGALYCAPADGPERPTLGAQSTTPGGLGWSSGPGLAPHLGGGDEPAVEGAARAWTNVLCVRHGEA
eukprot:15443490-Alexandrium_andersonii.AAC.1